MFVCLFVYSRNSLAAPLDFAHTLVVDLRGALAEAKRRVAENLRVDPGSIHLRRNARAPQLQVGHKKNRWERFLHYFGDKMVR